MSDVTILDATDPDDLADILDSESFECARKTGNYSKASSLTAAAEWLRHLSEKNQPASPRDTSNEALNWLDDIEECVIAIRDGSRVFGGRERHPDGLGKYYPTPTAPLRHLQEALDQIEAARVALTSSEGD